MLIRPCWVFPYGLWTSAELSAEWRRHGRGWAILGEQARSDWCHAWADYFAVPWWQAVFFRWPPSRTPPALLHAYLSCCDALDPSAQLPGKLPPRDGRL
jgi:hypothetical protein